MKRKTTKSKRKVNTKQNVQPVKQCLMSVNSYLSSYLNALDAVSARR